MMVEPIGIFCLLESGQKEGMRGRWELSDAQWQVIEPILRPKRRSDGRGRPWQDTRAVLNGILWVLGTGAQWRELPDEISAVPDLPPPLPAVGKGRQAGAEMNKIPVLNCGGIAQQEHGCIAVAAAMKVVAREVRAAISMWDFVRSGTSSFVPRPSFC